MKNIAIIYASHDGHTKKICQRIIEQIDRPVDLLAIEESDSQVVADYDVLVFGAAVRYGKHLQPMTHFISENQALLVDKKTAFFSVNLTARKPNRNTPETSNYIKKFLAKLDWQPSLVAVFAGKLDYSRYRFFDKHMIRFIMWITKGDTDLTTVKEYTDWQHVNAFAEQIKQLDALAINSMRR